MSAFFSSVKNYIGAFFSDEKTSPEFWVYLAANVVLTLFFMNIFFWLLWTLLVYKDGIFVKVIPILSVIFTSRTPSDYGYQGCPYELGIFEGLLENSIALMLLIAFVVFCWRVYLKFSSVKNVKG